MEQRISIERLEQAVNIFGSFDENIRLLEQEFNVTVVNRDGELRVEGDAEAACLACKAIQALLNNGINVKAVSHITGGGFYENIPRSIPDGLCAKIKKSDVRVLPIFKLIAETGNIPERDMYNTFNMGIGMILAVPAHQAAQALEVLKAAGETVYQIGSVVKGDDGVALV